MSRKFYRAIYYVLLLILLILFVIILILIDPFAVLLDISPQFHNNSFPKSFTGPLTPNNILSTSEKLFINQIEAPESIAVYNGSVFTGTSNGYIYKIDGNNLKSVIKVINNECPHVWNKTSCGRPLGMKFDSKGVLYVVEPSHGIYTVENISSNSPHVKQVFDIKDTKILGKASRFLFDIAIDENGDENGGNVLYISDFSTKYHLTESIYAIHDSVTGRLIKYNTVSKRVETVIAGLLYPTGVELTDDRSAVLVAEHVSRTILKHFIRGPKLGQTLVIASQLPGEPNNIRRSTAANETFWIAISMARNESNQHFIDKLNRYPLAKKLLFRFTHLIGSITEFIGNTFCWTSVKKLGFSIRTGGVLMTAIHDNAYSIAIEIDVNGNILRSLHSPDGSFIVLSEAREVRINDTDSKLYFGSLFNNYLGVLVLTNRTNG